MQAIVFTCITIYATSRVVKVTIRSVKSETMHIKNTMLVSIICNFQILLNTSSIVKLTTIIQIHIHPGSNQIINFHSNGSKLNSNSYQPICYNNYLTVVLHLSPLYALIPFWPILSIHSLISDVNMQPQRLLSFSVFLSFWSITDLIYKKHDGWMDFHSWIISWIKFAINSSRIEVISTNYSVVI